MRKRLRERDFIHVDLHMHTDHSHDCATPVDTLLAAAKEAGLGAIAVTDHNEVSGAHEARERGRRRIKVIVAEEVKTADQGEVIGLFIEEKIPRGMTLARRSPRSARQGGLVYVPHPFDRMHSVPDYEHLLDVVEDVDAIEVFNPRVAFSAFNEEAERFAAKYRIVAGAGSDSHVAPGLGSVKIRMRDFDGPEEFLESLRDADIVRKKQSLLYVQALKFIQTKATPSRPRRTTARAESGRARQRVMQREGGPADPSKPSVQMPATDDEIREKYLERAIRELNQLTREIQDCDHCPRGNLMPVLGSGHPQADIFMLKFAPRPSEIEEGVAFYGRAGSALMKSFKRLGIDPLAVYGTVFVKCPVAGHRPVGARVPRPRARGAGDRAAADRGGDGRGGARGAERSRRAARPPRSSAEPGRDPEAHAALRRAVRAGHRRARSTTRAPSASSGRRSARSASGTRTSRRTERASTLFRTDGRHGGEGDTSWSSPTAPPSPPELLAALKARAVQGPSRVHPARSGHPPRRGLGGRHVRRRRRGRGAHEQGVRDGSRARASRWPTAWSATPTRSRPCRTSATEHEFDELVVSTLPAARVASGSARPAAQGRGPHRPPGDARRGPREVVQSVDLEEHSLDPVIERTCAECGTKLTTQEIEASLETGGPFLCTVHASEEVSLEEDAEPPPAG